MRSSINLFSRLGRSLQYLGWGLLCLLLLTQLALSQNGARWHLSYVDRLEGQPVAEILPPVAMYPLTVAKQSVLVTSPFQQEQKRPIIIRTTPINKQDSIKIVVNNQVVADMAQGFVRITVQPGDVVAVDATMVAGAVHYVWESVPPGSVVFPGSREFVTKGNVYLLGTVKFSAE